MTVIDSDLRLPKSFWLAQMDKWGCSFHFCLCCSSFDRGVIVAQWQGMIYNLRLRHRRLRVGPSGWIEPCLQVGQAVVTLRPPELCSTQFISNTNSPQYQPLLPTSFQWEQMDKRRIIQQLLQLPLLSTQFWWKCCGDTRRYTTKLEQVCKRVFKKANQTELFVVSPMAPSLPICVPGPLRKV